MLFKIEIFAGPAGTLGAFDAVPAGAPGEDEAAGLDEGEVDESPAPSLLPQPANTAISIAAVNNNAKILLIFLPFFLFYIIYPH